MKRTKLDLSQYQNKNGSIDLEKFVGKKIKRVICGLSAPDGDMMLGIHRIVFDDDTDLFVEGAHDFAYLYGGSYGKTAKFPLDLNYVEHGDYEEDEDEDDYYLVEYD